MAVGRSSDTIGGAMTDAAMQEDGTGADSAAALHSNKTAKGLAEQSGLIGTTKDWQQRRGKGADDAEWGTKAAVTATISAATTTAATTPAAADSTSWRLPRLLRQ